MMAEVFPGKLGFQQRVLPTYRAMFFEALARHTTGGLSIFAGEPLPQEGIERVERLQTARLVPAKNRNFLDPASPWFMCWQGGFISWLEEYQPDMLCVEANPRYPMTRTAIAWMHDRGRKVIGWGLGAPPIKGPFARLRIRERLSLLHLLDAIIAYSQRGAEQYRQLGIPAEQVHVASNAVAAAPAEPPPERPNQFDGQPTILFVGRLQARKRVDLLIQACSTLPGSLQPRLVIVGDGPALNELRQAAHASYPNTEFTGVKLGAELEPYFSQADLFVLPGTGGLAIQQAMAHALPVIVAQGDGTQDDLVRSENGWQVPPDDLQALVNSLHQALADPARLRRMGEASYCIVSQEINIDKMVEVFIRAINNIHGGAS